MTNDTLTLTADPTYPWSAAGFGLPALVVVALLLTGITVWTYLGVRGATFRRLLGVLALRLGALLLAFLVVLRPALAFRDQLKAPSLLLIAVDDSESMTIQDEFDGQSRWERVRRALSKCEPELRRLREEYNVAVALHRFSTEVRPFDPEDATAKADGKRSDYGLMLHTLYERYRGERYLRGLLVMGDGADNGTRYEPLALAGQWRNLPCPVHTFAFGKTTTSDRQSDISVTNITTEPSPVPVKGKLTVKATVDAPGFENRTVRAHLLIDDQEVPLLVGDKEEKGGQEAVLRLTAGNEVAVTCLAPAKPGEVKVTLKIDKQPGELTEFNNEISTFVTVSKEGLGVLYVDKWREERFYLKNALATDPRIRVDEVILGGPRNADPAEADLFHLRDRAYDVIILGDVTADEVSKASPDAKQIADLVGSKGAGVIMIGGRRNFANGGWQTTWLRGVLPVDMSADGEVPEHPPLPLVLTDRGKAHFLLRLAADPKENEAIWRELKLRGLSRMGQAKGAVADVLLRSAAGDDILVAGKYGEGRTLAFAGDTTYLWVRPPKGDQYHERFWRQLVLWLAKQEETEGNVWVKPDVRRLAAGGRVGFSAGVRGKGGLDLKDARFDAKVIGPNGGEAPVQTVRDKDEDCGTFWKTDAPGEYRLVVKGTARDADGQEVSGEASARFLVYQDDAEMSRRAADHEFLKRLAAAGGGKFHPGDEEELARYLRELPSQPLAGWRPKADLWPDWRRSGLSAFLPALLVVFVALVSLEWFLRRRWGLV
jgi:uncharacterized membrane protein